jgi:hypothetical protein
VFVPVLGFWVRTGFFQSFGVTAPVPLTMQERLYACGWQGEVFHLVD